MNNVPEKFLGYIFYREGCNLDSKSFAEDVVSILSNHNGSFQIFNVFTSKTFYCYAGMVFLNSYFLKLLKKKLCYILKNNY